MKKQHIVKAMSEIIKSKAKELGLAVEVKGEGHGFDGSFWEGLLVDDSKIPNIKAENKDYKIELRSFWGSPELDVHIRREDGERLLVLNYSDGAYRPKEISDRFNTFEIQSLQESGLLTIEKGEDQRCKHYL